MVEPSQELQLVFDKAVVDAKKLKHEYVTVEHLLYAMLCTDKFANMIKGFGADIDDLKTCLLYTSPSPRDKRQSRMPSSA